MKCLLNALSPGIHFWRPLVLFPVCSLPMSPSSDCFSSQLMCSRPANGKSFHTTLAFFSREFNNFPKICFPFLWKLGRCSRDRCSPSQVLHDTMEQSRCDHSFSRSVKQPGEKKKNLSTIRQLNIAESISYPCQKQVATKQLCTPVKLQLGHYYSPPAFSWSSCVLCRCVLEMSNGAVES